MSDMSYGKGLQTANQQTSTILKHIKWRSAAYVMYSSLGKKKQKNWIWAFLFGGQLQIGLGSLQKSFKFIDP